MSTGNSPREDADLEAFLGRQSPFSADYDNLERVEPPTTLDDKVLAAAKVAAKPAPKPAPRPLVVPVVGNPAPAHARAASAAGASSAIPPEPVELRNRPRPSAPTAGDDDDDDDEAPPSRRPRWLVPAALAAGVLVATGVGVTILGNGSSDTKWDSGAASSLRALFAKRARERSKDEKAAADAVAEAAASQAAEVAVVDIAPLPPPPVFQAEGPQVQDLDAAIVLIRKELLLANNVAASQEEASLESPDRAIAAAPSGRLADTVAPAAAPAASAAPSVVQPRERRLSKILELYDGGNPDLAGDSLEIFLRDFEDDPISQRILGVKP